MEKRSFSISEHRTILSENSKLSINNRLSHVTSSVLSYVSQNPDTEWDGLHKELFEGKDIPENITHIIKNSFQLYDSSRQAISYWKMHRRSLENYLKNDLGLTLPNFASCEFPPSAPDCMAMKIPDGEIDEFYKKYVTSKGLPYSGKKIGGFYSENIYLEDDLGNKGGIVFSNMSMPGVVEHEIQHYRFGRYSIRENPEILPDSDVDMGTKIEQEANELFDANNLEETSKRLKDLLDEA